MQAADLTMEFLVQAAQIQSLKSQLDVPHLEMLSWWSNISTTVDERDDEDRSLYEQLFLNNAVLSPVDEAFRSTLDGERALGITSRRLWPPWPSRI
jgi:hypothetical protein